MNGFSPEALLALALGLAALLRWMMAPRKQRIVAKPPEQWRRRVYASVPQAALVPADLRGLYERQVETFLQTKRFIGCDGLRVDDEMRIAIAGLACLLILRPTADAFPLVQHILVYPGRFLVRHNHPDALGLVSEQPVVELGESWEHERVILSWADVEAALHGDEMNVAVHEFAHQLDDENPATEGAPPMRDYTRWAEVMSREFKRLQRYRRPPVINPYGAESPAEFFGVVTEAFFQRGPQLRHHHPELYAVLSEYYRLDPAAHRLWKVIPVDHGD